MNSYEEELQRNIETGKPVNADSADVSAYREVFRALDIPPKTSLSRNFADRIVARVQEKQKRESERDLLWYAAGISLMVMALVATILYTGFTINLGFLKEMSGYTGLFIFGVVFILLLNILDRKLLIRKDIK